jgi:hypothetical protein
MRNAFKISVGKPEGKRALGRPRRRREDNMKMDLRKIGWEVVDWNHVTKAREGSQAFVSRIINLMVS